MFESLCSKPIRRPIWLFCLVGQHRLATGLTQRFPFSLSDFQRRPEFRSLACPKTCSHSLAALAFASPPHPCASTSIAAEELDYPDCAELQALFFADTLHECFPYVFQETQTHRVAPGTRRSAA